MRFLSFIIVVALFGACQLNKVDDQSFRENIYIQLDLETKINSCFVIGKDSLKGAENQSMDFYKSGKYSVKTDSLHPYTLGYTIDNILKGDIIRVSVWRNSAEKNGAIVIADNSEGNNLNVESGIAAYSEGEWDFIQCYYKANQNHSSVKIYVYSFETKPVYFDDIKIEAYFNHSMPDDKHEAMEIVMSDEAYSSISGFRDRALTDGMISKGLKKYVDAKIKIDNSFIPMKLRLKGDWTDHLKTDKWSFRIKMKGNNAYRGLKSFSIQNPNTRSFMSEWFAHKLFEKEDVLTTKYIFVPVIINGQKMGVYALEEHFDKQLLEARNRREAPIVKFDEEGVWEHHKKEIDDNGFYSVPILQSSEIKPFKKNRTKKSPVLSNLFSIAQVQMDRYRNHDSEMEDYIDVKSMAKYAALIELLNGKHGLIWHNQRFYVNPITSLLEPIAYDCYTEFEHNEIRLEPLTRLDKKHFTTTEALFQNQVFFDYYIQFLKKFTNKTYLKRIVNSLKSEIKTIEELLQFEDPSYHFNKEYFVRNAAKVAEFLQEVIASKDEILQRKEEVYVFKELTDKFVYETIALKAYVKTKDSLNTTIVLRNFHVNDILIIGYSLKSEKEDRINLVDKKMSRYKVTFSQSELELPKNARYIYYQAKNTGDRVYRIKISQWPVPGGLEVAKVNIPSFIQRENNGAVLRINSGVYRVNEDIVIPKKTKLIIESGTDIDFINGAGFLSLSPVELIGTANRGVLIHSSDNSANGFTVIAPGSKSKIIHTQFNGFSSLEKYNRSLTGAVTFYESELKIENSAFLNNNCEDGVNLIRCKFIMDNTTIDGSSSDGFDADFCQGTVKSSFFRNAGNDCLDFSGSKITVKSCLISNAKDKGISCGENSKVDIVHCILENVNVAIVAKDLSEINVDKTTISDAKYHFAVYQKKAEYGPAHIKVKESTHAKLREKYLLGIGSILEFNDNSIIGENSINVDSILLVIQYQ